MKTLEDKYNVLFLQLNELNKSSDFDNESSHILQDKIYRKFIKDICSDKFSTYKDLKKIADKMKTNVVNHDKNRWYA